MQKTIFPIAVLIVTASLLGSVSCTRDEQTDLQSTVEYHGREVPVSAFEPDMIRVKLSGPLADSLKTDDEGRVTLSSSGVKSIDELASSIGATGMRRTFPPAGKFEARTREAGLHLWYNVYFDPSTALTRAGEGLESVEGIDIVEYCPRTVRVGHGTAVPVSTSLMSSAERTSATDIFNDPMLPDQWHYYNDGSLNNSVAGSDINVIPVWNRGVTGSSEVIVAVVDGGVDYTHEDLAANMWRNPEQSGDRVYGWNFVSGGPLVTADDHGTHVAGTIAAVNNNGKGVCGIAGGDGTSSSGVRIMSCQIFQGEDGASGAEAIKWAADHGAVIAQNSWGYNFESEKDALGYMTSTVDKAAIDYFIKNAGFDENGRQTGPMAGGIVIFAAGNDGWSIGHPGDYENCVAVAAIGADYRAAYYTNYGSWVDVAAPGGDVQKGRQVMSTLPGNQYGYMQGTSMACPHVSGVAALIVSENARRGYTSTALRKTLEGTVRDISAYNRSKYIGKGLVDAYRAVVGTNSRPPAAVGNFKAEAVSNNIHFSLTVPSDPDDPKPNMIYVYYSETALTSSNYESAMFSSYLVGDLNPGDVLEDVLTVEKFSTDYYVAAVATDYGGVASPLSTVIKVTTGENHAPVLTPVDGTSIGIKAWQTGRLRFLVSEEDGHEVTATAGPDTVSLSVSLAEDTLTLYIQGTSSTPGTHEAVLRASDPYGMYDEVTVTYTVEPNNPPVKNSDPEGVVFSAMNAPAVTMDMNEYFSDPDGEALALSVDVTSFDVANIAINRQSLIITPMTYGSMTATVTGTDALGEKVSTSFGIVVRDGSQPVDIYPNPVTDTLYVRAGTDSQGHVRIVSGSGATVYDKDVSVSVFSPAAIDMGRMPGGTYTVIVNYEGNEVKRNIVKL